MSEEHCDLSEIFFTSTDNIFSYNQNAYIKSTFYWSRKKDLILKKLTKLRDKSKFIYTEQHVNELNKLLSEIANTVKSTDEIINKIFDSYNNMMIIARNEIDKIRLLYMSSRSLYKHTSTANNFI